jgi:hypothetical protein
MAFLDIFKKKEKNERVELNKVNILTVEQKFEDDDLVGSAKDLKLLLELYGTKKKKNHRYKGRAFIYFILSNKHKELKNNGYHHWDNINQIIQLNHAKVYPYHKNNLRKAIDFFKKEVKSINTLSLIIT